MTEWPRWGEGETKPDELRQRAGRMVLLMSSERVRDRRRVARAVLTFTVPVFAVALAGGCGSSPSTSFYTLDPVETHSPPDRGALTSVQIAAVHVPATLDRREMVRETGANRLDIDEQNRWAAPLDEMIRRVLTQDMTQRLPKGAVLAPDEPATVTTKRIVVALSQFDRGPSGSVVLEGNWSLLSPGTQKPALTRELHLEERPKGNGYADDAASMSHLVGKLADDIASTMQGAPGAK